MYACVYRSFSLALSLCLSLYILIFWLRRPMAADRAPEAPIQATLSVCFVVETGIGIRGVEGSDGRVGHGGG
eukprot:5643100-Pyramimonas_sp.AAC.1